MGQKRTWPWLLGAGIGVIAVAAAAVGVWIILPSLFVQRHADEVRAKTALIRDHGSRPPILDDPLPGNAWDCYRSLAGILGAHNPDGKRFLDFLLYYDPAREDAERPDAVLKTYAGCIDLLRRSLRMSARPPEYRYVKSTPITVAPQDEIESVVIDAMRALSRLQYRCGRRREAIEGYLGCMALSQDFLAVGRYMSDEYRDAEQANVEEMKLLFQSWEFSAEELEFFARGLNRLEARRPTVADFLTVQEISERANVLEAVAGRPSFFDDFPFNSVQGSLFPRSWKTLYSRRYAQVRTLGAVRDFYRDLSAVDQLPSSRRGDAIENAGRSWSLTCSVRCAKSYKILGTGHYQTLVDLQRLVIRTAVALARFREATGADPKSFADLVPRYLDAVPVSPVTGDPLLYAEGTLTAKEPPGWGLHGSGMEWKVASTRPR